MKRKIYAASDHAGVALRTQLVTHLRGQGHEVVDLGPDDQGQHDYPDWAGRVGRAVRREAGAALGLLVCGSGLGVCIAANKLRGVRAVAPWDPESARLARSHNDANVLCLGARLLPAEASLAIADAWLAAGFDGGERHQRRLAKIAALEAGEEARAVVDAERARLESRAVVPRIWVADPRAFTPDPVHEKSIRNRLGWLRAPEQMQGKIPELEAFAASARADGFKQAVLLGMGGSSLCVEVLAEVFAGATRERGGLEVRVLDNTDPEAVSATEKSVDLERTLFIVASKSGGTIEVRSFERYFWHRVLERRGGDAAAAARQFVAITDPGTELDQRATAAGYRAIFRNAPDIGGRYSALSYFGLVPAALLGVELAPLLAQARAMADACREQAIAANPGADLGATIGGHAKQGRDKLTLLISPEIAAVGAWIEQLVAESTGKLGKGIVPVDGEPLGPPEVYGPDRLFVVVELGDGTPPASDEALLALEAAGHPVARLRLPDRSHLGAELFRWEMATAVAGASLQLNPFDEPNVTEAKEATRALLERCARDGSLPPAPAVEPDDAAAILPLLDATEVGDYLAVCAFVHRTAGRHERLVRVGVAARALRRVAATLGYGPRYLHSTGQLHKGGAANGVFLQVAPAVGSAVAGAGDLPIPGEPFTFGTLRDAQALGDFQVLQKHGRRAVRVSLGVDIDEGLRKLLETVTGAAVVARTPGGT